MDAQMWMKVFLLSMALPQPSFTAQQDQPLASGQHEEARAYPSQTVASSDAHMGPRFADQWSADVVASSSSTSKDVVTPFGLSINGTGTYMHDGKNRRWRQNISTAEPLVHPMGKIAYDQLVVDTSGLNQNFTVGSGDKAVCKPTTIKSYADAFSAKYTPWDELSRHVGPSSVAGERCEVWAIQSEAPYGHFSLSVCLAKDGAPREFNETIVDRSVGTFGMRYIFSNVKVGPPPDGTFRNSEACAKHYPTKSWPPSPIII